MERYEPIFYDIETTGTNPLAEDWHAGVERDARVTCVGVGWFTNWRKPQEWEDVEFETEMIWHNSEYVLLENARERLEEIIGNFDDDVVPFRVGWNIKKFDDPYIGARYNRYRQSLGFYGPDHLRFDMMKAAADEQFGWNRGYKESEYAELLGVELEDETDGSDMPEMFDRGDWEGIAQHCRYDVEVMMEIFWLKREMMMNRFYDYRDINMEANFTDVMEL